ncbi:MAG: thioredoxin domain-containing protein [bacterium]|nr:MAG: thioredoxin domain-containing protein [bacterium]
MNERNRSEEKVNRLIGEKSPYLQQHARNPVDWYPWGNEAFLKATAEDKPIFLSIGYSTCHWCHVMERESFEDPEVARRMNEAFVCIKVDREERPDIDQVYMAVCQLLTGGGGWPLTVIMTPDRKPFFAGTYFPRESRFGRTGMLELVPRMEDVWKNRRSEADHTANEIIAALEDLLTPVPGGTPGSETVEMTYQDLCRQYDSRFGGFGRAPKFPLPGNIFFLLRHWRRAGEERALQMAERTLQAMSMGGIYDQIGFGFHRYSTDEMWLVPHFEKMLYDQALLAMAFTEAYQATGKDEYGRTAEEIFTYILRDMSHAEGGFYSAEDADSEGVEGKFYTWTAAEVDAVLEREEAQAVRELFRIREGGNHSPETGQPSQGNILHRGESLAETADRLGMEADELTKTVSRAREKLLEARDRRIRPSLDDKILTDWNGLMLAALAKGASAFSEPRYARAAERAADFLLLHLRQENGRLFHRYREGEAAVQGNLDDYSFLTWGLIELYQATFEVRYLQESLALTEACLSLLWDDGEGGFFFTAKGSGPLSIDLKTGTDGATPSGNAVSAMNLLRLSRMTANPIFEDKVARIARAFSTEIRHHPSAFATLVSAMAAAGDAATEVVITGDPAAGDTREMSRRLRSAFLPDTVLVFVPATDRQPIVDLAPYTGDMTTLGDRATAYVCRDFICRSPTTDIDVVMETIGVPERPSR